MVVKKNNNRLSFDISLYDSTSSRDPIPRSFHHLSIVLMASANTSKPFDNVVEEDAALEKLGYHQGKIPS